MKMPIQNDLMSLYFGWKISERLQKFEAAIFFENAFDKKIKEIIKSANYKHNPQPQQ